MSFACPECGYKPEDTWVGWNQLQLIELVISTDIMDHIKTRVHEAGDDYDIKALRRCSEEQSKAFLVQCPACCRFVVSVELTCPLSDITDVSIYDVVKLNDVSLMQVHIDTYSRHLKDKTDV